MPSDSEKRIQKLEGIIQTQNAKIEQAQNKELEMSFAEEELEKYVADLVAANVIETDKTSRLVELMCTTNMEVECAQLGHIQFQTDKRKLQKQILELTDMKEEETLRGERLTHQMEQGCDGMVISDARQDLLNNSRIEFLNQVLELQEEATPLRERAWERSTLTSENAELKQQIEDIQAQALMLQEDLLKMSNQIGNTPQMEEMVVSNNRALLKSQQRQLEMKLENKTLCGQYSKRKKQLTEHRVDMVQAQLSEAGCFTEADGWLDERVAVLEAENRAKVEALVEFQERLNNTQRELRAALAQNQKYEEDLRQSAAETAAREAEDVVVAAQYEKEALDALAEANAAGDDKAIAAAEAKVECARDSLAKEEHEADVAARVAAETEEASLAAQAEISAQQVEAEIEIEHSSPVKSDSPDPDESEEEVTMSDFQKMMATKMLGC